MFGGIILICTGLLFGCRGIWDQTLTGRHTQNLSGFATMGLVTWIMLANFEPAQTYGTNRQTIYLIVPLVVGMVVIFCMPITYQLYLMLIGGLGGLTLGLWILGWKENLTITSQYGIAILLTVLVLVFMIMSLYHYFFHVLGAALSGSYIFFMGLDIFFHTGFLYAFTTTLDVNPNHGKIIVAKILVMIDIYLYILLAHHYETTRGVYIMQSTMIISFIVTYIIQGVSVSLSETCLIILSHINIPCHRKYEINMLR